MFSDGCLNVKNVALMFHVCPSMDEDIQSCNNIILPHSKHVNFNDFYLCVLLLHLLLLFPQIFHTETSTTSYLCLGCFLVRLYGTTLFFISFPYDMVLICHSVNYWTRKRTYTCQTLRAAPWQAVKVYKFYFFSKNIFYYFHL